MLNYSLFTHSTSDGQLVGLFLVWGDCEQCCRKYPWMCLQGHMCMRALGVQELSHCLWVYSHLLENANCFLKWLCQFSLLPAVYEITRIGVDRHYNFCQSDQCFVVFHFSFTLHFPDVEHLLMCLLTFWSSFEKCSLKTLAISLPSFPSLTDLDWRLLKNFGTLLRGQILRAFLWPNGKKILLWHLWSHQLISQYVTGRNGFSIMFLLLMSILIAL